MYKDGKPVEFERLTFVGTLTVGATGEVQIRAETAVGGLHILSASFFRDLNLVYELPRDEWPSCWDEAINSLAPELRNRVGVCTHYMAGTTLFDRRTGARLYYIEETRHSADVVEAKGEIYSRKGELVYCEARLFVGCEELEVQINDFEPYT